MDNFNKSRQHFSWLPKFIGGIRIFRILSFIIFLSFTSCVSAQKNTYQAESAELIDGISVTVDNEAFEGNSVSLTKPGDKIIFRNLHVANKLAIRYASVDVGTISVAINDQPSHKVNAHSSGALTGSFLYSIVDIEIPNNASLTISLIDNDVALNIDQIIVGNGDLGLPPDIWNLPPLPIADGPYKADWKEISRIYSVPDWWREAKFGAWSHWDPQSMPESGDWYARAMYMEGNRQYNFHLNQFGHVSEYGYKDISHNWVIDRWDPEELMNLYVEMGARYFMAMGVHHDNFDCWDSEYQPWNSVNVGPKVDIVGIWEKIARQHGLPFGIGFHNTPARTWGQFMTVRYTSDKEGPMQGVPYDALETILDGKGKWWEGLDPVDLYGPIHDTKDPLHSPFTNQFMWRIDDAISKYHPDMIYFDEHAGDSQVDLGVNMGLGFLAPQLIANYYNKSLKWSQGEMNVVVNLKAVGGRYNSFQNSPNLLPFVDRALVKSTEFIIEPEIMAYPFQTETSIADWHYQTGMKYMQAPKVIESLMQNVSRNGTMLLNLSQRGRGDLDPEVITIAKDVGAWLKINGEAIYGSRPFEVYGNKGVCYTRNKGNVYATVMNWNDSSITFKELKTGGSTIGKVTKVELIGSNVPMSFIQDGNGLIVTPDQIVQPLSGIANKSLSSGYRVLRITHDKGWFNDDDPSAKAPGWFRYSNLDAGDYNNDLTISDTPGDVWSCSFTGNNVSVIAPKEEGAGKIEIQIDGKNYATVDLSTAGERKHQQVVFEINDLASGNHILKIINRGHGKVAIDALLIN